MIRKNFKFLAAFLMLCGTLGAYAQGYLDAGTFNQSASFKAPLRASTATPVTHDYAWYEAKTYTWTDANGATKTAKLTDEVTNPYQMYDMLKWVYCNPEIPGSLYSEYTRQDTYYGRQRSSDGETGWNITDNDVTAPTEAGQTLFLVKLRNYTTTPAIRTSSKSQLINYFTNYVESIQLLTDGLRAGEGENEGTMFNVSGEFNRFFIIGKGKSYYCSPGYSGPPYAPFYNMFEEYSPTSNQEGDQITDFYEKMNDGEVYPVIHDCTSVIYFEHYFSMSGKAGTEEKSLTGMVIFIPDNRNVYSARNYDTNHQPKVGLYVIQLDGNATPGTEEKTYDVTLDWTSALNEITGSEVPQNYTVYVVLTDENGNQTYQLLTNTTETTYTYTVPQDEHSYTISYIVYGEAAENDTFTAWSNIADVVIPGWNDFLVLGLNHYESDYRSNVELNYYRNFLTVANAYDAVTPASIAAGMNTFTLYRYDLANPGVMIPVAELKLTVNGSAVSYNITYDNQEILPGHNVTVVTNGNLGYYGQDEVIDLGNIMFVDQFTASTAENAHPNRYGYVMGQDNMTTNTVEVPVMKTASTIDGFYTLDEIMSDTDRHLTLNIKNANVEMPLVNNPSIYYYTIERGDNVNPNTQLSKLQRRTDGTFIEMNNTLGLAGNIYNEGMFNLFDDNILTGVYSDYATYVPVIWTFGSDRVAPGQNQENSYGSPIYRTGVARFMETTADVTYTAGDFVTWRDENNKLCCIYNPVINISSELPDYASIDYDVFMYRVWRLNDEIRNYTYDPVFGYLLNDETAERNPDKLIVEDMTNETSVTYGDRKYDYPMNNHLFGGLSFGAVFRNPMNEEPQHTSFIVRMYYKKNENAAADAPMYYVIEKEIKFEPTVSVNEINVSNEISTTYVNAQGMTSDKPFDGLNIVITRHADGTTHTYKVVK